MIGALNGINDFFQIAPRLKFKPRVERTSDFKHSLMFRPERKKNVGRNGNWKESGNKFRHNFCINKISEHLFLSGNV